MKCCFRMVFFVLICRFRWYNWDVIFFWFLINIREFFVLRFFNIGILEYFLFKVYIIKLYKILFFYFFFRRFFFRVYFSYRILIKCEMWVLLNLFVKFILVFLFYIELKILFYDKFCIYRLYVIFMYIYIYSVLFFIYIVVIFWFRYRNLIYYKKN